jgi:hypothetical protein
MIAKCDNHRCQSVLRCFNRRDQEQGNIGQNRRNINRRTFERQLPQSAQNAILARGRIPIKQGQKVAVKFLHLKAAFGGPADFPGLTDWSL